MAWFVFLVFRCRDRALSSPNRYIHFLQIFSYPVRALFLSASSGRVFSPGARAAFDSGNGRWKIQFKKKEGKQKKTFVFPAVSTADRCRSEDGVYSFGKEGIKKKKIQKSRHRITNTKQYKPRRIVLSYLHDLNHCHCYYTIGRRK